MPDDAPAPPPDPPLPTVSFPAGWLAQFSPPLGVALTEAQLFELAVRTLIPGNLAGSWAEKPAQKLANTGLPIDPEKAEELLFSWWQLESQPLPCARAALRRGGPACWFTDAELAAITPLAAAYAAARYDEKPDCFPLFCWLLAAGFGPHEAGQFIQHYSPYRNELPSGQWLSCAIEEGNRQVFGYRLPAPVFRQVRDLMLCGAKIPAIKLVREVLACGLKEAKDLAEAIEVASPSSRPAPPQPEARDGQARRALDAAIERLILRRPFHWAVLAMARLVEERALPTMAVGFSKQGELHLFYAPSFVLSIRPDELEAVLEHEVHHILFGHLAAAPDTPVVPVASEDEEGNPREPTEQQRRDQRAWVIACEVTANEFVSMPLPGSPVVLDRFGLPPGESTLVRYGKLRQRDDLPQITDSDLRHRILAARPAHSQDWSDETRSAEGLAAACARWSISLVGDEIDRATLGMLAGSSFGGFAEQFQPEGLGELPWNELLRHLARGLPRRVETRRFPSKRAPERIGVVPGRRSVREKRVVMAVVDTSGSMSSQEMSLISSEIAGLQKLGLRVALVQCDAVIHEARWLEPGQQFTRALGRGGTDLRPPFAPAMVRRFSPSLIVYFTDGYGPAPAAPPPGVEVLWVLTGQGPCVPARYGRAVCMRPRRERNRVKRPG